MLQATSDPQTPPYPSLAAIEAARERIAGVVRTTPLERSAWLSDVAGCDVYLKLECWQPTRSFKVRGATAAILAQLDAARERGVVTASAGNHGQAIALAARAADVRATVFVPGSAPAVKRDRIRALGASLDERSADYDAAEAAAVAYSRDTGALFINAFSEPDVVAGQGTIGLELLAQLPSLREVIAPVGGGGLISGIAAALRGRGHGARVLGAQSELTHHMHAAWRAGRLVDCPIVPTLADGLAGCTDQRALDMVRLLVDDLVLVSEAALADAMRGLLARDGVLVEGSAAAPVAAILEARYALRGPTVIVLSGGNVDLGTLVKIAS